MFYSDYRVESNLIHYLHDIIQMNGIVQEGKHHIEIEDNETSHFLGSARHV